MTQQKTNKGCKGYYWTDVQNIEDMKATKEDMVRYYEQKQY